MNDISLIIPDGLDPKPIVTCVIEGILEEADLAALCAGSVAVAQVEEDDDPAKLKKLREKHHSVARLLASGLSQRMIAPICGYTESYLSILVNNPAMIELIELYRLQQGEGARLITEKLRTVGLKAVEKIDEAIDNNQLSKQELLQAAKLGLDRGGHGPASSQHIVREDHIIDHAEVARRNKEASQRSAVRIVRPDAIRKALPAPEQKNETDGEMDSQA